MGESGSTTLGKAYVQILPSAKGIKGEMEKLLEGEADKAGSSAGSSFSSAFGSGLKTIGKISAGAFAAAAGSVAAIAKEAVEGFADYEQLTGGVETLFKNSSDIVMGYAENAFQTAGMSANEYMETVTGFSASLIQSLGGDTEKAALTADVAITDMADNANKMGSSMESIQNAYQGFAKQNYTMLDNLKLGYGGTKSEMERLLADASEIAGVKFDISSYSDVINAIHVMQEEMGIAGTTQKEAAETISGSIGMLKSSWKNLIVGFSNNDADLSSLVKNVVDSAKTVMTNILPVAQQAIVGIGDFVREIGPVIVQELPGLVDAVLPSLIGAAGSLLDAVTQTLPSAGLSIILTLADSLIENLPMILNAGFQTVGQLATGIADALPELIPAMVEAVVTMAEGLIDNADMLIDAALELIMGLAEGLMNAAPLLVEKGPELVVKLALAIIRSAPKILETGVELVYTFVEGIFKSISAVLNIGEKLGEYLKNGLWGSIEQAKQWGSDMIDNFVNGIMDKFYSLRDTVKNVGGMIKSMIGFSEPEEGPLSNFHTYAPDMMELFIQGVRDKEGMLRSQIQRSFNFSDMMELGPVRLFTAPRMISAEEKPEEKDLYQKNRNLTVILELDRTQLGRMVYTLNDEETQRVGVRLARGGV